MPNHYTNPAAPKPAKKKINSRAKGCRGERLWRDVLREHGYTARRGQQFAGGTDSPDVICEELDKFHFEVKAVQTLNIHEVMRTQAAIDAGDHKIPVIAHKRNNEPWKVYICLDDCLRLLLATGDPHKAAYDFFTHMHMHPAKKSGQPTLVHFASDSFFTLLRTCDLKTL